MSDQRSGWERLARLLVDRRVQLGTQYRNRLKFAADTGLNERLLSDLENFRRTRYRPTSLRAVEAAYRWEPGSIDRVLDGDAPIEMTPPGGFHTSSSFPAMGVEQRHGADTAVLAESSSERRLPSWFATEVSRRGLQVESLAASVEHLRNIGEHFGYTLRELLLTAELASEEDMRVSERPTSSKRDEALADFDEAIKRITASPRLSPRGRKDLQQFIEAERRWIIEATRGDR